MAQFRDLEVVKLRCDVPDTGLRAGAIGAVVMVYPQQPQAYEVEFVDDAGATVALVTLLAEDLEAA